VKLGPGKWKNSKKRKEEICPLRRPLPAPFRNENGSPREKQKIVVFEVKMSAQGGEKKNRFLGYFFCLKRFGRQFFFFFLEAGKFFFLFFFFIAVNGTDEITKIWAPL